MYILSTLIIENMAQSLSKSQLKIEHTRNFHFLCYSKGSCPGRVREVDLRSDTVTLPSQVRTTRRRRVHGMDPCEFSHVRAGHEGGHVQRPTGRRRLQRRPHCEPP
jgi:hypothetical protein